MNNVKNKYVGVLNFLNQVKNNLEIKQRKLEELSMDEVRKMWDVMGANGETLQMDLSWVASQENINTLSNDINRLYNMITTLVSSDDSLISKYTIKVTEIRNGISTSQDVLGLKKYNGIDQDVIIPYCGLYEGSKVATIICPELFKDNINIEKVILTSLLKYKSLNNLFSGCTNLKEIKDLKFLQYDSKIVDIGYASEKSMLGMFSGCTNLSKLDVSNFDTSNITSMRATFNKCSSLTSLDLTSWDTHNVTDMCYMFSDCTNLTEILVSRDKWVISSNCSTSNMFNGCGCSEVTYVD